jgi:heterodisulfide reductase subunit C2
MIRTVNRKLEGDIERRTGQKVRDCYQCKKCSAGCPVAFAMDLVPHEVMKLVQYGQEPRLLECSTIWLCASCETCSTRCPNEIDIAGVMDGLRQAALEKGVQPGEPEVEMFHKSFLNGIRFTGKTNEPVLIGQYKAMSRRLFDDIGLGAVMFAKRKIKMVPRVVKDRASVRRIFARTRGGARP